MKFDNYLLELENNSNKEYVCLDGTSEIVREIYLDIKKEGYGKIKELLEKIKIPYQTLYSWVVGSNPIPIIKLYEILNLWRIKYNITEREFKEKWDLVYSKVTGYSQNSAKRVILPRELNHNLAYLIGYFQGDGHLKKELKKQENSIHFYDGNLEMLEKINEIIEKEFGIKGNVYFDSCYRIRVCSRPIYMFFKEVLGLRSGRKTRSVEVPEVIRNANLQLQLSFIKGFFDAEGTVGENYKNPWLEVGQASKDSPCEILIWIREKLNENSIYLSEPKRSQHHEFFRIRIAKRETIKRFFELVSSSHPIKKIKFEKIAYG